MVTHKTELMEGGSLHARLQVKGAPERGSVHADRRSVYMWLMTQCLTKEIQHQRVASSSQR